MSPEYVRTKREELIHRQIEIQAQLSELKLGGSRWLSKVELAQREKLAAEHQRNAADLLILKKIAREAEHQRVDDTFVLTSAIAAAADLKDIVKLVTGFIGDVHDVLRKWRAQPPADVQTCISDLAAALGEAELAESI